MGDPLQGSADGRFIYDTGSGFLTATSAQCFVGCETRVYDPNASTTCNRTDAFNATLPYGSANLTGTFMRDRACLPSASNDLCADNFTLFAISSAQGLEGLDGILGFSPVITDEPMVNNTNIVRGLYEAGLIDSEVATFQINGENV